MKKNKKISFQDPNAKALWSKKKNVVYKDKTKYTRKEKHKDLFFKW